MYILYNIIQSKVYVLVYALPSLFSYTFMIVVAAAEMIVSMLACNNYCDVITYQ